MDSCDYLVQNSHSSVSRRSSRQKAHHKSESNHIFIATGQTFWAFQVLIWLNSFLSKLRGLDSPASFVVLVLITFRDQAQLANQASWPEGLPFSPSLQADHLWTPCPWALWISAGILSWPYDDNDQLRHATWGTPVVLTSLFFFSFGLNYRLLILLHFRVQLFVSASKAPMVTIWCWWGSLRIQSQRSLQSYVSSRKAIGSVFGTMPTWGECSGSKTFHPTCPYSRLPAQKACQLGGWHVESYTGNVQSSLSAPHPRMKGEGNGWRWGVSPTMCWSSPNLR